MEVYVDSDDSDLSVNSDEIESSTQLSAKSPIVALYQIVKNPDAIDKLCTLCVGSKSTQVIRCNKSMTITTNKLEEVHVDL